MSRIELYCDEFILCRAISMAPDASLNDDVKCPSYYKPVRHCSRQTMLYHVMGLHSTHCLICSGIVIKIL